MEGEKLKNSNNTYDEIMSQIESWEKIYEDIVYEKIDLDLNIFSQNYDEIIFFGCGSSYNLSQSASFFTKSLLDGKSCLALPSSELLVNTDTYISKDKKYLVIGFSRSGETGESIDVIKKLAKNTNMVIFTISCKEDSSIVNLSNNHFTCRDTTEKSIVMTKSFSAMLLAYCLILTKSLGNEEMIVEFKYLIDYLSSNINMLYESIDKYVSSNYFSTYFVLGSGVNYGLAVEADLKMKEMSQVSSYSYYLYEFNHGPKSLINKESLCLILTLSKNLFKVEKIIEEILKLGSKVIVVGCRNIEGVNDMNINYILDDSNFKIDIIKSFINIPVFQILAYLNTIKKNLNPDKPKNLSYIAKI